MTLGTAGVSSLRKEWAMKLVLRALRYTTRWDELLRLKR
jgi:hypothetical protein